MCIRDRSKVLRASAGASRGARLLNSTFFTSVSDIFAILPVPRTPRSALGLPVGALGGALDALGPPLGLPKGALGYPWGPFWSAFWSFRVIFEALKGPRAHQGPNWELFWLILTSIFINVRNISTRESACKLEFATACITRSALLPAQVPTRMVAVGRSPLDTSSVWHRAQAPSNYYHYYYYYYYYYYYL